MSLSHANGFVDQSQASRFFGRYWATLAIFAIAAALCAASPTAGDVSWLISLNEKVLSGKIPYVDFVEVNPPASIYLYTAPVWLAQTLSLRPEFVVALSIFIAAAASLAFCNSILQRAKVVEESALSLLAALFAFLILVLPAQLFGQREHIALIAFLPALCVYWLRGQHKPVPLSTAVLAGLGSALIVIIKPHMVMAVLLCAATTAFYARSIRPILAIEHWVAALLAAAYGVFVFFFHRAFIDDVLPMVMSVYVPIKAPLSSFLIFFATPFWLLSLAGTWALIGRRAFSFPFALLIAASVGFSCSYYIQQKGWAYHAYPMLALGIAALVIAFNARWPITAHAFEEPKARIRRLGSALGIALLIGSTYWWFSCGVDMRALVPAIKASVAKPKLLTISADLGVGHPLTRQVEGEWVSQVCGLWMTAAAIVLKNTGASEEALIKATGYAARERRMLLDDIWDQRPDIIIVDRIRFDWYEWAKRDAEVWHALMDYRPLEQINDVLILRRNERGD